MATISNLVVNMIARTANFEAGMKKSNSLVSGFTSSLKSMATTAIAAFSVNAIKNFVVNSIDGIDTMSEFAESIDISINSLRKLEYGATQSGIGIDDLRKSFTKMSQSISEEFGKGGNVLGISADKLMAMSPEAAFMSLAESISKIQNPFQRTAAAMDIFGKSGARMLAFLDKGKAGLDEFAKEAEKSGYLLNEMAVVKVGIAADSIDRLKLSFRNLGDTLATEFSGGISKATSYLGELVDTVSWSMRGISKWLSGRTGFGWLETDTGTIADNAKQRQEYVDGLKKMQEMNKMLQDAEKLREDILNPMERFAQVENTINKLFTQGIITVDEWAKGLQKAREEMEKIKDISSGIKDPSIMEDLYQPAGQFQEVNPSMINVAALNPQQNIGQKIDTTNNLLREIRDGQVA